MRKLLASLGILALLLVSSVLLFSWGPASSVSAQSMSDDGAIEMDRHAHRRGVSSAELSFSLAPGETRRIPLPRTRSPIQVIIGGSHVSAGNGVRGISNVFYVYPDPATGKLFSWTLVAGDQYSTVNDVGPGGPGPFDGVQLENHSAEQGDPQTISYQVSIWW